MNITQIEDNIKKLVENLSEATFIYDLLLAYGTPKATISRLRNGDFNQSKKLGEVILKKKLVYRFEETSDLHQVIDELNKDSAIAKHHPRFLIVTDFKTLLSMDTVIGDTLDIPITDLAKHFDFFLPWAGMEKSQYQSENPADIKAAERMGRLYDFILESNPVKNSEDRHALNIFFSRLLFCFFAEDTGIFPPDKFTNGIGSHTREDGSDLQPYLEKLFAVLSTEKRDDYPKYLQQFPYVNGGLFKHEYPVPQFNTKSRKLIVECGSLNWKAINPDIFGSMMQAVVHTEQRSSMGMHYTSVVNIMKVIEPLFLNDLYEQFEKAGDKKTKLEELLDRIYNLKVFDPACGSGNFLIIAYKELCKLEIEIFKRLHGKQTSFRFESQLKLSQFYGIEIDDFACETARLSLWLTQHQMNVAFKEVFGESRPTLPLQDSGNIVCGNATRIDWKEVCSSDDGSDIYILGNPPYLGSTMQSGAQKKDLAYVCKSLKRYKNLDYVSCWFVRGAEFIAENGARLAFVSTNSICQGEQVSLLWPRILQLGVEIGFAYNSFKWANSAKGNAGVVCIVVGLQQSGTSEKYMFNNNIKTRVSNISPYLQDGPSIIVSSRRSPISNLPLMTYGNKAVDGGNLILDVTEKNEILKSYPESKPLLREFLGSSEYIRGTKRYCFWISDDLVSYAKNIPIISERIELVRQVREASKDPGAVLLAKRPHQFRDFKQAKSHTIIVPRVSSDRREYIPYGFLDKEVIVSDSAQALYDSAPWVFAVISSKMHMIWVRTVGGRLKTDYRYSSALCYNTFPFPQISKRKEDLLDILTFKLLDEREAHPEKTPAQLYDPDLMPEGLRAAHHEIDIAIERCYRDKPFKDDNERLEYLFRMYSEMTSPEIQQGELYA